MATPSTNGADPGKDGRSDPRRLRWSVPRVDVSTNRWLDLQNDISHSLQLLIRESIQRDGYIDVVNRPIEQLPRRGRPPLSEAPGADDADDGAPAQEQEAQGTQPVLPEKTAASAEAEESKHQPADDESADDHSAAEEPEQEAQPKAEPKQGGSGLDAFLTS